MFITFLIAAFPFQHHTLSAIAKTTLQKNSGRRRSISTLSNWESQSLTLRLGVIKEKLWRHNGLKGYLLLICRVFQLNQLFKVNYVWFGRFYLASFGLVGFVGQVWFGNLYLVGLKWLVLTCWVHLVGRLGLVGLVQWAWFCLVFHVW